MKIRYDLKPAAAAPHRPLHARGAALLRPAAHRPHVPHGLRGRRLARPAHRPLRPVLARPRRGGAPLQPGDLRGGQGLQARRRRDLRLPHRQERRAAQPLRARASACRPSRSRTRCRPSWRCSTSSGSGSRSRRGPRSTSAPS